MYGWFPRFTLHTLAVLASLLAYVLTTRAERERRAPSVAIAWVLGLIALPYVVLPAYLFFGRRKLSRPVAPWLGVAPRGAPWAEELIESVGLPGAAAARVQWQGEGRAAREAVLELIDGAHTRLDACTYILGYDEFGRAVADRLRAAALRGVRVRLLIDGVGALQLPRSWLRSLNAGGVRIAIFSPLTARRTPSPRNLRNHRKWGVADEARLWAGGRNLAAEYFTGDAAWLDLSFTLEGPVAATAAGQFEADWRAAGGPPSAPLAPPRPRGRARPRPRAGPPPPPLPPPSRPRPPAARTPALSSCQAAPIRPRTPCTPC